MKQRVLHGLLAAGAIGLAVAAISPAAAQRVTLEELKTTPREQIAADRIIDSFSELENEAARRAQAIERQREFLLLADTASDVAQSSVEIRNLRSAAGESHGDAALRRKALHRLAERYLDRGDVTLGLLAADEALSTAPPAAEADEIELVKGELLAKAGRGPEAEALYAGLVASASSADARCRALNQLGRAVAKRGDIDNGLAQIEQGLALNAIDENPHTRLSLHSGRIRVLDNARREEAYGLAVQQMRLEFGERANAYDVEMHFCNVLKSTPARQDALRRMEQAVRANPGASTADRDLFVLGREYRKDRNTEKVLEVYGHYIQTYPGNTFFTTKAYQYMIDALLEEKRLVLAADTMEQVADFVNGTMDFRAQMNLARSIYSNSAELGGVRDLARATFAIGYENAMRSFAESDSDEERFQILVDVARYAYAVGVFPHIGEAEQLAEGLSDGPEFDHFRFEIQYYKATSYFDIGMHERAKQEYDGILRDFPNSTRLNKIRDRIRLAEIHLQANASRGE